MKKNNTLSSLKVDKFIIQQISAKRINKSKNKEDGLNSKWECKIDKLTDKELVINAKIKSYYNGFYEINANVFLNFEVLHPIKKSDVLEHIGDILYVGGANYTLITSFLTNYMFPLPLPIAPKVEDNDIIIID